LAGAEWRSARRRAWLGAIGAVGILAIVVAAGVAASRSGDDRVDTLLASSATVLLYGGLAMACALGATVVNRPSRTGYAGLVIAAGAGREGVVLGALIARSAALAVVVGGWTVAAEVASLALGQGLDGDLAVHGLATVETLWLTLAGAALASTAFAPVAAGAVGLAVHVAAQAIVNLKAAVDAGAIGDTAAPAIRAAFGFFPRVVTSPLISDLQARDAAAAAAPRFEINRVVVTIPAAGVGTVLWTLLWVGILAALAVLAFRRRPL
jgi:hypothetical protein